jgi:hypothetical protein
MNVQDLLTIYRLPITFPEASSNHDMTIQQFILNENLSETDFSEIFILSDLFFPINDKALFITDEHELIVIGKDNALIVFPQWGLASCIQIYYVYLCDKH